MAILITFMKDSGWLSVPKILDGRMFGTRNNILCCVTSQLRTMFVIPFPFHIDRINMI